MIDRRYYLEILGQPTVNVPEYNEVAIVTIFAQAISGQTLVQDVFNMMELWVDNTPPIVKDVVLNEIHDVVNDTYSTDVSFTVVEPIVDESHSDLPTIDALKSGLLKVYVDDAPFYASPVLDSDGFWITSLWTEPLSLAPGVNTRTATASFTLPYRLPGHTMEVEVSDTVGNQGRYVLYPQGGNF